MFTLSFEGLRHYKGKNKNGPQYTEARFKSLLSYFVASLCLFYAVAAFT